MPPARVSLATCEYSIVFHFGQERVALLPAHLLNSDLIPSKIPRVPLTPPPCSRSAWGTQHSLLYPVSPACHPSAPCASAQYYRRSPPGGETLIGKAGAPSGCGGSCGVRFAQALFQDNPGSHGPSPACQCTTRQPLTGKSLCSPRFLGSTGPLPRPRLRPPSMSPATPHPAF